MLLGRLEVRFLVLTTRILLEERHRGAGLMVYVFYELLFFFFFNLWSISKYECVEFVFYQNAQSKLLTHVCPLRAPEQSVVSGAFTGTLGIPQNTLLCRSVIFTIPSL